MNSGLPKAARDAVADSFDYMTEFIEDNGHKPIYAMSRFEQEQFLRGLKLPEALTSLNDIALTEFLTAWELISDQINVGRTVFYDNGETDVTVDLTFVPEMDRTEDPDVGDFTLEIDGEPAVIASAHYEAAGLLRLTVATASVTTSCVLSYTPGDHPVQDLKKIPLLPITDLTVEENPV